jgi:aerobic carbon-monoxide dehydrogenase medium subunit
MKPPPFAYHAPATTADAIDLLNSHDNAVLLAGGQSLMPMLNMRYVFPDHMIDLNRVKELSYIREGSGMISIGSMTRQRDIEFSSAIASQFPVIHEAVLCVGHRQTRNRGTIGGSLCNLDPSAELPAVSMLLDAVLTVRGEHHTRDLAIADFCRGYMQTALDAGELLTEIRLRPWAPAHGSAFVEYARRHGDFAIVSAAVLIETGDDNVIRRVALVIGGAAHIPQRMENIERELTGQKASSALFREAAQFCGAIEAIADAQVPSWYRKRLAVTLSDRALNIAWQRTKWKRS